MRAGRVDEASAVARRVGQMIEKVKRGHPSQTKPGEGLDGLWKRVGVIFRPRSRDRRRQISQQINSFTIMVQFLWFRITSNYFVNKWLL